MSDLTPEARTLLDAVRLATTPTAADRARVEQALTKALHSAPPAPVPTAVSPALLGVAGLVGLVAVAGALFVLLRPGEPLPATIRPAAPVSAPAVQSAPAAPVAAQPTEQALPPVESAPAVAPSPKAPARRAPAAFQVEPLDLRDEPAKEAPAIAAGSSLAEELRLLQGARAALESDPEASLALLAEHERRFPAGALAEERVAARVEALCAAGRVGDARSEADRFLAEHAASPYAARVRAACR